MKLSVIASIVATAAILRLAIGSPCGGCDSSYDVSIPDFVPSPCGGCGGKNERKIGSPTVQMDTSLFTKLFYMLTKNVAGQKTPGNDGKLIKEKPVVHDETISLEDKVNNFNVSPENPESSESNENGNGSSIVLDDGSVPAPTIADPIEAESCTETPIEVEPAIESPTWGESFHEAPDGINSDSNESLVSKSDESEFGESLKFMENSKIVNDKLNESNTETVEDHVPNFMGNSAEDVINNVLVHGETSSEIPVENDEIETYIQASVEGEPVIEGPIRNETITVLHFKGEPITEDLMESELPIEIPSGTPVEEENSNNPEDWESESGFRENNSTVNSKSEENKSDTEKASIDHINENDSSASADVTSQENGSQQDSKDSGSDESTLHDEMPKSIKKLDEGEPIVDRATYNKVPVDEVEPVTVNESPIDAEPANETPNEGAPATEAAIEGEPATLGQTEGEHGPHTSAVEEESFNSNDSAESISNESETGGTSTPSTKSDEYSNESSDKAIENDILVSADSKSQENLSEFQESSNEYDSNKSNLDYEMPTFFEILAQGLAAKSSESSEMSLNNSKVTKSGDSKSQKKLV